MYANGGFHASDDSHLITNRFKTPLASRTAAFSPVTLVSSCPLYPNHHLGSPNEWRPRSLLFVDRIVLDRLGIQDSYRACRNLRTVWFMT